MAELRHSSSIGSRATPSPMKRDDVTSPLAPDNLPHDDDGGRDRHPRDRVRSFLSNIQSLWPFFPDETRAHSHSSKISLFLFLLVILVGLLSLSSTFNRWNAPYLCTKDGIVLHCPRVKETPSLWENPISATTSWKPCAERRNGALSGSFIILPVFLVLCRSS